jgi:hypothetical protein
MGPLAHARQRTGSFTAAQASHMPPLMSVQAGGTTTVPEIQPSAAHTRRERSSQQSKQQSQLQGVSTMMHADKQK